MIQIDGISKTFGRLAGGQVLYLRRAHRRHYLPDRPQWSGKTPLFNILAGFIKPDEGRVLLDGEDVTGLPPHKLFHKGIVRTFQIPHEFSA